MFVYIVKNGDIRIKLAGRRGNKAGESKWKGVSCISCTKQTPLLIFWMDNMKYIVCALCLLFSFHLAWVKEKVQVGENWHRNHVIHTSNQTFNTEKSSEDLPPCSLPLIQGTLELCHTHSLAVYKYPCSRPSSVSSVVVYL